MAIKKRHFIHEQALKEIRLRRKLLKFTQLEMDTKIFAGKGVYKRIEQGVAELNMDKLHRICKALGLEAKVVFYELSNKLNG